MNSVVPLGDQAALAYFVTEDQAFRFAEEVRRRPFAWLVDVVQAYKSVAVFDLVRVGFAEVAEQLRQIEAAAQPTDAVVLPPRHEIPCCYELGPDLARVAEHTGLPAEEVIRLHSETEYTVYAIGFCPGFPYLGYLPPTLHGMPRLPSPRLRVDEGSVGLTGRQTGIYTEVRPGGWNLVGRTPLQLVDVRDGYFPLRTGHRVRFVRIDESTFRLMKGERLTV